jgi:hypothetical protein
MFSRNLSALRLCEPFPLTALRGTGFSPCEVPLAVLGREDAGNWLLSRRRIRVFLFAAGSVALAVVLLLSPLF